MTSASDNKGGAAGGAADPGRRRARVEELERRPESPAADAQTKREHRAYQRQKTVIALLAGTVVITTPMAFLTLKRWWHWWNS